MNTTSTRQSPRYRVFLTNSYGTSCAIKIARDCALGCAGETRYFHAAGGIFEVLPSGERVQVCDGLWNQGAPIKMRPGWCVDDIIRAEAARRIRQDGGEWSWDYAPECE